MLTWTTPHPATTLRSLSALPLAAGWLGPPFAAGTVAWGLATAAAVEEGVSAAAGAALPTAPLLLLLPVARLPRGALRLLLPLPLAPLVLVCQALLRSRCCSCCFAACALATPANVAGAAGLQQPSASGALAGAAPLLAAPFLPPLRRPGPCCARSAAGAADGGRDTAPSLVAPGELLQLLPTGGARCLVPLETDAQQACFECTAANCVWTQLSPAQGARRVSSSSCSCSCSSSLLSSAQRAGMTRGDREGALQAW